MNGIIILAAGASKRLGQPKQLLEINNENLLSRMIRMSRASDFDLVSVVLGAHMELILPQIDTTDVHVFLNSDWESGMASSLRCGLKYTLREEPELQSVLVLVVDQPFVTLDLINEFLAVYQDKEAPLVAAHYNDVYGVPALFDRKFFPELLDQKGHTGARKLIQAHKKTLVAIPFPQGALDIDTEKDWKRFQED